MGGPHYPGKHDQYVGAARDAQYAMVLEHRATSAFAEVLQYLFKNDPLSLTTETASIKAVVMG